MMDDILTKIDEMFTLKQLIILVQEVMKMISDRIIG